MYIDQNPYEINASELYTADPGSPNKIFVKNQFIVNGVPYALNNTVPAALEIHHQGIDLVKNAAGRFMVKNMPGPYIEILSVID